MENFYQYSFTKDTTIDLVPSQPKIASQLSSFTSLMIMIIVLLFVFVAITISILFIIYKKKDRKLAINTLTIMGTMGAINILLSYLSLSFRVGGQVVLEIGIVTVTEVIVGFILGPLEGVLFGLATDTISTLLHGYIWSPFMAIQHVITPLIAGIAGIIYHRYKIKKQLMFAFSQIFYLFLFCSLFLGIFFQTNGLEHENAVNASWDQFWNQFWYSTSDLYFNILDEPLNFDIVIYFHHVYLPIAQNSNLYLDEVFEMIDLLDKQNQLDSYLLETWNSILETGPLFFTLLQINSIDSLSWDITVVNWELFRDIMIFAVCALIVILEVITFWFYFHEQKQFYLLVLLIFVVTISRIINSWFLSSTFVYIYYGIPYTIGVGSRIIDSSFMIPIHILIDYFILRYTADYLLAKQNQPDKKY